ncbi:MAG TPA: hypothetical protein VE224_18210 [Pseudolabrys sp.]|nr:hypothetical protein [Pseudolabrys sp.]
MSDSAGSPGRPVPTTRDGKEDPAHPKAVDGAVIACESLFAMNGALRRPLTFDTNPVNTRRTASGNAR